jgi:hypothetical protein
MSRTRTRRSAALILASAVCAAAAFAVVQARTVSAATLTVTTSGDPSTGDCTGGTGSLRQCIAQAAALGGTNVIAFAASTNGVPILLDGTVGMIDIPATVDHLTIRGNGQTNTIIDGNGAISNDRIFQVDSGGTVSLQSLTLQHGGLTINNSNFTGGGAILDFGTLSLSDVKVANNSVTGGATSVLGGGAIQARDGTSLTITNSTFSNNSVTAHDAAGGAIQSCCATTSLAITGSTFSGNSSSSAYSNGQSNGGAVVNGTGVGAVTTISNSTFTGNSSSNSGGGQASSGAILNRGASMIITNSVFRNNTLLGGAGGAISNCCGGNATPTLQILNSLFDSNSVTGPGSSNGGGVATCCGAVTTITGSTFTRNSVTAPGAYGGGVSAGSAVTVANSTLVGNTASAPPAVTATASTGGFGGNIGVAPAELAPPITLLNDTIDGGIAQSGANIGVGALRTMIIGNTIVSGWPASNCQLGQGTTVTDKGHNLEDGTPSTCGFSVAQSDKIGADPKLGALQNNGGATPTQALLAGSAAIDKADNVICAALPVAGFDQRGLTRFPAGDTTCDIGAYEVQPVVATATPAPTATPRPTPTSAVKGVISTPRTGAGTTPPESPVAAVWLLAAAAALLAVAAATWRPRRRRQSS